MTQTLSRRNRTRKVWRKANAELYAQVEQIIEDLRDYWPLTLRQVYYQAVAAGIIPNHLKAYKRLSSLLSDARFMGYLVWECMEDRSRTRLSADGWLGADEFITDELDRFLAGYRRDLQQSQATRLEIWVEKDALAHVVYRVADPWCVSVIVAKGWSSVTFKELCRQRAERDPRPTRILYFGDLDPSGWQMLPSMMRCLEEELGLANRIEAERVALNPDQVIDLDLPRSPDALKEGDRNTKRYREWLAASGHPTDLAVELDALPPATLQELASDALRRNVDLSAFVAERQQQAGEQEGLADLRQQVQELCNG